MSSTTEQRTAVAVSGPGAVAGAWQRVRAIIGELRGRWRQRRELATMDIIGLHELSLTAVEAQQESEKPFWSRLRIPPRG